MDPTKYVLDSVTAIATAYAQQGIKLSIDKAKEMIEDVLKRNPSLQGEIDIEDMAKKIEQTASPVGRVAYNEETLARFLEIPIPELATINLENLEEDVLFNHVKLEGEFREWFQEWGYEVQNGCSLMGLRGVEYISDVYGCFNTLHGQFEICVNFVCDTPPDEDRVFALLGRIEAYAEAKKSFSYGDIFAIVTPQRFTQGALNAISLQNEQENYYVFPLDGGDIYVLENARSPKDRLEELRDKVRQAEDESRRSKIRRNPLEPDYEMS